MGGILDAELFGTAIRQATPLILAALGGLLSERVGVVNIGLEGKILMGAFAAALGTLLSGSLWVGLAAAVLVGLALALIHAVATQELRTDHIVSGVAINLLALGLSTYLFRQLIVPREEAGESSVVPTFGAVSLGGLENLPLLNALLKDQSWADAVCAGVAVRAAHAAGAHALGAARVRGRQRFAEGADDGRAREADAVSGRAVVGRTGGAGRRVSGAGGDGSVPREHERGARLYRAGGADFRQVASAGRGGRGARLRLF
jgi:ribose/xylose/arabinose/galactoside ABC-type transport system permease subunit